MISVVGNMFGLASHEILLTSCRKSSAVNKYHKMKLTIEVIVTPDLSRLSQLCSSRQNSPADDLCCGEHVKVSESRDSAYNMSKIKCCI